MRAFTVTATHHPDRTVVTVCGEMDLDTCPQVEEATTGLPAGDKTLYLDLTRVSFIDSMGLNTLLRLRHRVQTAGGRLVLTGLQDRPGQVLHLTDTYVLFDTSLSCSPH
ncbi:hypothetical protein GCM10022244_30280 [Streptomyces gulbargensis]|uniref:Anti-sigma factor antagonist n=1 Tax=Streptomyces gulbargensis TaxID=364901 RepID=A0ABP7MAG9_9ACTN